MWLFAAHPIILQAYGITIFAHGLFFALAAEIAVLHVQYLARKKELDSNSVPLYGFIIFIAGLVAARIGFFLTYPSAFTSVGDLLAIWHGGLVSYWGMIVGLLTAYFLFRNKKEQLPIWLDIICLSGLLGWSIGRLGNYYAADSVGVLNTHFGLFYGRVPIQLFESIGCLLLFLGLRRYQTAFKPGQLAFLVLAGYFAERLLIDAWRDEGYLIPPIHTSQVISGLFLCVTAVVYLRYKKTHA
jgi:phosphatidylglycerol:prolipoprotein diacylglycerol transferase